MKFKPFLFILLFFVCASFILTPAITVFGQATHTVKKGDTLWDLSQKYYNNPYLWPALWALNYEIAKNPHFISEGDTLVIYEKEKLVAAMKPAREEKAMAAAKVAKVEEPESLYEHSQPIETFFPKYFTYLANPDGLQSTGINRIRVKKIVFYTKWVVGGANEVRRVSSRKTLNTLTDVQEVAEIIASDDRGYSKTESGDIHGRSMLSFFDNVIVSFSKDVAQILDSEANGDKDPYFREYPIYAMGVDVMERTDKKERKSLGTLHRFKGTLKVVAKVETSDVKIKKGRLSLGDKADYTKREPVYYVARITMSKEPIEIGDRVFIFKRIE